MTQKHLTFTNTTNSTHIQKNPRLVSLTGLPDALWVGKCVTENSLVPGSTEAMNDFTGAVQNRSLNFILNAPFTPVTRLQNTRQTSHISSHHVNKTLKTHCGFYKTHFDEGDLTRALVTIHVTNDDITIVFKPSLLTKDILNARHRFIPLVMIAVPEQHISTLSVSFIKSEHCSNMGQLLG